MRLNLKEEDEKAGGGSDDDALRVDDDPKGIDPLLNAFTNKYQR